MIISIIGAIFCITLLFLHVNKKNESHSGKTNNGSDPPELLSPPLDEFLCFIEAKLDSTQNVGAALTIVTRDQILLQKAFGVKKVGSHDSVDLHTVFRLASISKGFAGVLACILEEDGLIHCNDRVITLLPSFALKDSVNTHDLTISHVLSHTSGLIPHAFDNLIEEGLSLPLILTNLKDVEISAPPGKLYGYQNVIFSLIDTICYLKTGVQYSDLIAKRIFKPLRMRNASVGPEFFMRKSANIAYPHTRKDTLYRMLPVNFGYYNISPAAGINASISDLSKWLQALLGRNPNVLDSMLLDKISTPLIETPLKRKYTRYWDHIESKYYSLGWRIYFYKGRKIMYHGGFVRGYRAEIAFCPDENIGIAFVQNSPNSLASMSIPAFFDVYFHHIDNDTTNKQNSTYIFNGFNWLDEDSFDFNNQ
jgi:beta-lactamase class C